MILVGIQELPPSQALLVVHINYMYVDQWFDRAGNASLIKAHAAIPRAPLHYYSARLINYLIHKQIK
jgi:hypothetical protein